MHRTTPLHPILVHFTIALVGISLLFDVVGRVYDVPSLSAAAWWTIATAVPVTVATIASGIASRRRIAIAEGTGLDFLRWHVALGPTFFGCLVGMMAWRAVLWNHAIVPGASYLLALGAITMLMTAQGYVGGELVYRFGLGVRGDHDRLPLHRVRARDK